jgi:hypothetical protein
MAMHLQPVANDDGEEAPYEHQSEQDGCRQDGSGDEWLKQFQHGSPFMSGDDDRMWAMRFVCFQDAYWLDVSNGCERLRRRRVFESFDEKNPAMEESTHRERRVSMSGARYV